MARRATNVTRSRIQAVALELFQARGYDATSLQQIAAALDVTKPALYYHFPSKAALLHSLADPFVDAERALLDSYGPGPLDAAASLPFLVGAERHADFVGRCWLSQVGVCAELLDALTAF